MHADITNKLIHINSQNFMMIELLLINYQNFFVFVLFFIDFNVDYFLLAVDFLFFLT